MNPLVLTHPDAAGAGLASSYRPLPGIFDELMDADGRVRAVWRRPLEQLDSLSSDGLARRWDKAKQLIHENGVSYNVYGDPQGMERPWNLSPIPVVIGPEDWSRLSRGLEQRGRLLAA